MTRFLFCVTFVTAISVGTGLPAQPRQDFRFQINGKPADKAYDLISMGTEGLALIRDLQKYEKGNKKWSVELLDTTLTRFWSRELELDNRLSLVGFEHLPGRLYLLFRESQTTYLNFQLATLNFLEDSIQLDPVKFELQFQMTHFTVAGNTALFGGYINSEAAVLLYNNTSDRPKVLPGLFTKDITLLDLRANINGSFNVLLLEKRRADHQLLLLRTFDPEGSLIVEDQIDVDARYSILSGMTSQLIQDEMLIAGTYGAGNNNEALGVFSVVVDPFGEQPVFFTDLGSIPHFLDYLPEKKAKKVFDKIRKDKSVGKPPTYKANLLPIRLAETGNSFYLFAESYHPPSHVNYYPYGNPAWNNLYYPYATPGYPYRATPFDNAYYPQTTRTTEVKMIQSIVIRFHGASATPGGATMAFDDVRRPILDQTGDFIVRQDSILIAYKYKSDIFFQTESGDPMIRPVPAKVPVRLAQSADALRDEEDEGGLRFWFGRHFYAWGYRKVRGPVSDTFESRYEFYVNRLDF